MHFEVLVEDRSGRDALQAIIPKIIGVSDTYRIHPYRGIGRLPAGLKTDVDPKKKMLLTQLPALLQGYGRTFAGYGSDYRACVIVVCDIDSRCRHDFRGDLLAVLSQLHPRPPAYFCIAEEEGEAWLLGDPTAVTAAFPHAKQQVLFSYVPDAICGTWEVLADAVHSGGSKSLSGRAYSEIGRAKCYWAQQITPHMDVEANASPSFSYFRDKLRQISLTN